MTAGRGSRRSSIALVASLFLVAGCSHLPGSAPASSPGSASSSQSPTPALSQTFGQSQTLAQARKGFETHLIEHVNHSGAPDVPPPGGAVRLVHYRSPVGVLPAYLAPVPTPGRHPAIIWITGGDYNSIGDVWSPEPADNDQTAAQYRDAGIVTLYPSLRGGNDNPGDEEGFLGETDDILAAADFLAARPDVDPRRIYLGGHSTGGTMALIESEYTDRFRAVFSFGPMDVPSEQPGDPTDPREQQLRSPIEWLASLTRPTFVFEGDDEPSNSAALAALKGRNTSRWAHFYPVAGYNHFSVLGPVNRLLAAKIVADTGPTCAITVSPQELAGPGQL